jgi:serine/threonine protein kinase
LGPINLGVLYRAEYPDFHVDVDLVFLHPEAGAKLRDQFSRAAALDHPNIASVRAVGETPEGVCYVAFDLFRGELLSEILAARHVLSLPEAADLVLQAAAGLKVAHEAGLLHGNLSPDTILVTRTLDDRPLVKLIRFGAVEASAGPVGEGGVGGGHAAPERLAEHSPDERSDVYSLGAVLHHLLTGAPPGAVSDSWETVPDAVRAVISKALDPLPQRRFPTVAAFARALAGVTTKSGARSRGRARGARAAAAFGAVLIVVAAGLWLRRTAERPKPDAAPVEAAARRDTGEAGEAGEAGERAASPSAPADTAPGPPPLETPRRAAAGKAAPSPAAMPPPAPEPTVADSEEWTVAEPERPESLAVDTGPEAPPVLREPPAADAPTPPARAAAPAAPRPAPPERVAPKPVGRVAAEVEARAAVSRAVASYARALESSDLQALQWAYPKLTERERAAWKKFFSVARGLVVTLNVERYAITDSEARLDVRGSYRYWNRSLHRSEWAPVKFLATLERSTDGWRLTDIR